MQLLFEPEVFEFEAQDAEVSRSSHAYIRWLQRSLNQILGARLNVDGVNGAQTRSAVRIFQQRSGINADGVAGPATERALVTAGADKPPGGGSQSVVPVAPGRLIKREDQPPAYTLYVNVKLGSEGPAKPMTGIYVPENYKTKAKVDLILYLHGHKSGFESTSIDGYWSARRSANFLLRELVLKSDRNVTLVAPTLGPRSQSGGLTRPGGFDAYIGQVLKALAADGPYQKAGQPELGNLILACHSGGGWPMRLLATGSDRSAANIRECWGFDCLYNKGDETAWADWARSDPKRRLFIYYLGTTATRSKLLAAKKILNVSVERSSAAGHNLVPAKHLQKRIEDAPFLATH